MKTKSRRIIYVSREVLNQLVKDPDNYVYLVKQRHEIAMQPFHMNNMKESIIAILLRDVGKYLHQFEGILLGFQNVMLVSPYAMLYADSPTSYNLIQAEFFVFRPVVGAVLKGIVNVNKKNTGHIGCLVHQTFNVTIPKPENKDEWMGDGIKLGAEITFEITETNFMEELPYIRGVLRGVLSEPDSGLGTNSDEADQRPLKQSPKKKRKKHDDGFAVPNQISKSPSPKKSAHVSFAEPLEAAATASTSTDRGKKRKHAENSDDDFQTPPPKTKRIKKEKLSDESDHGVPVKSPKKKVKVKREKLSEDSDNGSLTDLDLGNLLNSGRLDLKRESLGSFTDMASKGKARRKSVSLDDNNLKIERCSQFELPEDSELEAIIKTEGSRKKKKVKLRDTL